MNDSRAKKSRVATGLSRELSLLHTTMMGVGMMIGAGVFIGVTAAISARRDYSNASIRPKSLSDQFECRLDFNYGGK